MQHIGGYLSSVLLLLSLAWGGAGNVLAADAQERYLLGAGDKVRIQVFGEDDLTVESLVGDAGTIAYPFLGHLPVRGKTVAELQQYVYEKLKGDYLVKPEVTVSILEYRQFFVNGYVKQPGGFSFQPGMTVRKAITLAGGFQERANKNRINLVRGDNPDAQPVPVSMEDLIRPGDILTVERSFF